MNWMSALSTMPNSSNRNNIPSIMQLPKNVATPYNSAVPLIFCVLLRLNFMPLNRKMATTELSIPSNLNNEKYSDSFFNFLF